jgi:hypothetical protein
MKGIFAALGALYLALAFSTTAQAQANPPGVDPEHYQCYTITQPTTFPQKNVRLQDQFGVNTVTVIAPRLLCAPVSKNGGVVADTRSHLVCYTIKNGKTANKRVETVNQFGKLQFTVNTANLLCLPSFKKVLTAGAP